MDRARRIAEVDLPIAGSAVHQSLTSIEQPCSAGMAKSSAAADLAPRLALAAESRFHGTTSNKDIDAGDPVDLDGKGLGATGPNGLRAAEGVGAVRGKGRLARRRDSSPAGVCA